MILIKLLLVIAACGGPSEGRGGPSMPDAGPPDAGPTGLALLGAGTHVPAGLEIVEVAGPDDRILTPRDIALHPTADHQLWVLNNGDSSVTIVFSAGAADRVAERRRTSGYDHFMPLPAAMAFGDGTMATGQETARVTQPTTPADFMGPTLWPSDADLFGAGHASHLDMLHNSPLSTGIAWEAGNAFWVFDGYNEALDRYDFGSDHGPGGEDHSDGVVQRWAEGEVSYVEEVSSHMEMDRATGLLYVADTGNARVAVLDTRTGTPAGSFGPDYDGATRRRMDSAPTTTLVDGAAIGMTQPSGLALRDGVLYVGDRASAIVHAFDLGGVRLDYLDLSSQIAPGSLGALDLDVEGRLYVADIDGNRVLRVAAPAGP